MKNAKRYLPFVLTLAIVVADQVTKVLVMRNIPLDTIAVRLFGDLVYICHVRNTGAAFSLGAGSSDFLRILLFIIMPIALMGLLAWAIVSRKDLLTPAQRWLVAGILGGGTGTLVDRIFRFDQGVVDFISIKFFGIFGLDRWPTFNVSDSCVVVFVILFALTVLFTKESKEKANGK